MAPKSVLQSEKIQAELDALAEADQARDRKLGSLEDVLEAAGEDPAKIASARDQLAKNRSNLEAEVIASARKRTRLTAELTNAKGFEQHDARVAEAKAGRALHIRIGELHAVFDDQARATAGTLAEIRELRFRLTEIGRRVTAADEADRLAGTIRTESYSDIFGRALPDLPRCAVDLSGDLRLIDSAGYPLWPRSI